MVGTFFYSVHLSECRLSPSIVINAQHKKESYLQIASNSPIFCLIPANIFNERMVFYAGFV